MKKVGLCLAILLGLLGFLSAIPQPLEIVQWQVSKTDKFEAHHFSFHGKHLFVLDQKLNQIRKYDVGTLSWAEGNPLTFPKQLKITDFTIYENNLSLIDSGGSRIMIYDLDGSL
ncbi:MAG: hypothetical protein U1C33_06245, partial [Candidatus Cloacimonadaceae bacterium]|nr:hypothetical protein [Candidatus Cloacimonadaceae bacterium]